MAFLLDDDQRQIVREAERLLADNFSPDRLRDLLERTGSHDQVFWTACRDMGWTAITIAEEYGGLDLGPVELCLTAQVAGRFVAGAPFLSTSFGASEALRRHATPEVRARLLPGLAAGETIGAVHLSAALDADATPQLRDGALHGALGPVAAGLQAGLLVTLAHDVATETDVMVLAELDARTRRAPVQTFDNSRGYADLAFEGAPASILTTADARKAALDLLAGVAVVVAFEQLGVAEACLERARAFANERQAFGQPIGKFQAIKHRVAEIYVATELARGTALSAVLALRDNADDLVIRAGAARLCAIEASELAAREAIQTHGAIGVTWEHDLHLYYRRSRALALELCAAGRWEDVVAERLVAHHARDLTA
ncbi:acyl-CoA dehydrogenase family protein [Caulobacter sp. BK020]|uniref:acyl-CoA dehydrogenase family protein n=1 Tax=Caulobacter sp. BK020 TaxID=2512117 RepID=UPI0010EA749E|nr:acyl-CoA dehydrogenase family protein [Caulobacter sp. BK020]TCS08135.1 alkylation response protein AidB-like acyl-CoA dehydrogenase [Caulobacter sp. BK020]